MLLNESLYETRTLYYGNYENESPRCTSQAPVHPECARILLGAGWILSFFEFKISHFLFNIQNSNLTGINYIYATLLDGLNSTVF